MSITHSHWGSCAQKVSVHYNIENYLTEWVRPQRTRSTADQKIKFESNLFKILDEKCQSWILGRVWGVLGGYWVEQICGPKNLPLHIFVKGASALRHILKMFWKQESIPVGCILPAHPPSIRGVRGLGGMCDRGGMRGPGGWGALWEGTTLRGRTGTCKNITFPQPRLRAVINTQF